MPQCLPRADRTGKRLFAVAAIAAAGMLVTACGGVAETESPSPEDDVQEEAGDLLEQYDEEDSAGVDAYRLLNVESCTEIEEIVQPLLTNGQSLVSNEVTNTVYPDPAPYSFECSFDIDGDDTASVSVRGFADFRSDSLEDLRQDRGSRATELTADLNAIVFVDDPAEAVPSYLVQLASPIAPLDGLTGYVSIRFHYQPRELSNSMPGESDVIDALFALLEHAD